MPQITDLQFVFVIGKGGVGKTTASAALALAAASRGKRVLIALCNSSHEGLSSLLGGPPLTHRIRTLLPGVDAVNMVPEEALAEYGQMVLKVRALYKALFGNAAARAFLHGTPGIDTWALLGKAFFHATETLPSGERRYDMVIVDAPATGHGLSMLRVPEVIVGAAPPGLLRREAERALTLFHDEARSGVLMVTLAEEMPVTESLELHAALREELHLPLAGVVVNRLNPALFPAEEAEAIESSLGELPKDDALRPWLQAAAFRVGREKVQSASYARLKKHVEARIYEFGQQPYLPLRRAHVEIFAQAFL